MSTKESVSARTHLRPFRALALGVAGASLLAGSASVSLAQDTATITVVDPHPANWLWVTWNTMEELVHVDADGQSEPALATSWEWTDDHTLEFHLRKGVTFQNGEKFASANVKQAWDRMRMLDQPHPPGKWLNHPKGTTMTVKDDYTVDVTYPDDLGTGNAIMKFRGMHLPSKKFFAQGGWQKDGSAEAHW